MIDRLEGRVLTLDPTHVVLAVGGVGFHAAISVQTYERLGRDKNALLYTHLYVREDILQLYGFHDTDERAAFRTLISISGIGPRVALALLSSMTPDILRDAVAAGDWKRLTAAPGVGRKLAERMTVELRGKLPESLRGGDSTLPGDDGDGGYSGPAKQRREAVDALVSLGHNPAQAEKLVAKAAKALDEDAGLEALIRRALAS